jgi:two-component system response regulator BaeR
MNTGRVLIVEDEPKIAALLADYLRADGFEVELLASGAGAVGHIVHGAPDLVLLDVMLPGVDGLTICREVRAASTVPIIMLTARVQEIDRLLGLELGADDYVCKPFSPREVLARVKAVLRRTRGAASGETVASMIALDEQRFEARVSGVKLALTPVEFRLLKALVARPGHVLSRAQLLDALYLDHRIVGDRTVDTHVKNLRRKIAEAAPGFDPLQSVYGIGYRFEP